MFNTISRSKKSLIIALGISTQLWAQPLPIGGSDELSNDTTSPTLFQQAHIWQERSLVKSAKYAVTINSIALKQLLSQLRKKSFQPTTQSAYTDTHHTGTFPFPLPDGKSVNFIFTQIKSYGSNRFTLFGHGQSRQDIQIVLSSSNGYFSGSIFADGEVYQLSPNGKGQVTLSETKEVKESRRSVRSFSPISSRSTSRSLLTTTPVATANNPAKIDIMILYTPKARDAAGGHSAIEAQAQSNVDVLNLVFQNSSVHAEAKLVYTGLYNYLEQPSDLNKNLNAFSTDPDVLAKRDKYGADLVQMTLFRDNSTSFCGFGYISGKNSFKQLSWAARNGFQVTGVDCGDYVSVHEFGHNMGLGHNIENISSSMDYYAFPWAFGYYINQQFRTIMSYPNPCTKKKCPRIPYFSSPNTMYKGQPLGVAGKSNNTAVLNATTPIIAQFRASKNITNLTNLTGLWYDPDFVGSGFDFLTYQGKTSLIFYGYTADGKRLWLVSGEPKQLQAGNPQTFTLYAAQSGTFTEPKHDLSRWGTLTVTFNNCRQATATLDGKDGIFTYANLVPLAIGRDMSCS